MTSEFKGLDGRSREVLASVIVAYIESAVPVSSRQLTKGGKFGLSSASLRNAMADLEDLGFLTHPHVSAGTGPDGPRVPRVRARAHDDPSPERGGARADRRGARPGALRDRPFLPGHVPRPLPADRRGRRRRGARLGALRPRLGPLHAPHGSPDPRGRGLGRRPRREPPHRDARGLRAGRARRDLAPPHRRLRGQDAGRDPRPPARRARGGEGPDGPRARADPRARAPAPSRKAGRRATPSSWTAPSPCSRSRSSGETSRRCAGCSARSRRRRGS